MTLSFRNLRRVAGIATLFVAFTGFAPGFVSAESITGTVTNKTGPTSVTLAGETWSQYAGDLTTGDTTEHIVLLIAGHTTNTVILATLAPKSTFASDDTKFFQPMLKSLAFLQ